MSALRLADVVDFSTFGPRQTIGLTNRRVRGPRAVLEWVMRAWLTPAGSLPWARDRGFDITALENGDFTLEDLYNIKASLEREARLVMYIRAADVRLTLQQSVLTIDATISMVDGVAYPLGVKLDLAAKALADNLPIGAVAGDTSFMSIIFAPSATTTTSATSPPTIVLTG